MFTVTGNIPVVGSSECRLWGHRLNEKVNAQYVYSHLELLIALRGNWIFVLPMVMLPPVFLAAMCVQIMQRNIREYKIIHGGYWEKEVDRFPKLINSYTPAYEEMTNCS